MEWEWVCLIVLFVMWIGAISEVAKCSDATREILELLKAQVAKEPPDESSLVYADRCQRCGDFAAVPVIKGVRKPCIKCGF